LIRLPVGALLFPGGDGTDLTKLRDGRAVSRNFKRRAIKLGFPAALRLHDLRGSHETVLLDAGVSVRVVAERCGHDPAVLLRNYAKRTKKADAAAADIIGTVSASALGQK
jgi:integrase